MWFCESAQLLFPKPMKPREPVNTEQTEVGLQIRAERES